VFTPVVRTRNHTPNYALFGGKHMATSPALWAIVVAGGDGKRLTPLTTALYGHPVPKQFAVIAGATSLLTQTLERVAKVASPARTIVVATSGQEELARIELVPFPDMRLVLQPSNRDTASGILMGLSHVHAYDPHARVLIVPSDHYARDADGFVRALREVARWWSAPTNALTLLGVRPDSAESEYGWIALGPPLPSDASLDLERRYSVECFVEKPDPDIAQTLYRSGALWNTFILAGLARTWWGLCEEYLPDETLAFRRYREAIGTPSESLVLREVFATLSKINFSERVLERIPDRLGVVVCDDIGWSDLGTPRRVFDALEGTPDACLLKRRLADRERQGDAIEFA